MGAGYHGGFGKTKGAEQRNRIGHPVPPTQKTLDMALNPELHAKVIAKKYGINLRGGGKEVSIKYNKNLRPGVYGITRRNNPYVIEVGPSAAPIIATEAASKILKPKRADITNVKKIPN